MLSKKDAIKLLLESVSVKTHKSLLPLDEALNYILYDDVHSSINVPEFDNSAMDGYVIKLQPEQINSHKKLNFPIIQRIAAGDISSELKTGSAARIFTGACIPKGANCVVVQEKCILSEDKKSITIAHPVFQNENIRPRGNDIKNGEIILTAGKQLRPEDIALIASVGIANIKVFNKIKVGVFFTGDELVEPGHELTSGKIFNSNRYFVVALLNQLNCEIVNLGNIKDDFATCCNALKKLASNCDLIITTGGVSVGAEDHIKSAVDKLGKIELWRINIKPGKPLAFGKINNSAFIGLPGNPVSAFVTFLLFVKPFIKKMQGCNQYINHNIKVKTNFNWNKANTRQEFIRVKIDYSKNIPLANLYHKQGSDILSSIVWADGLLEIEANKVFSKGEILNFYSFN